MCQKGWKVCFWPSGVGPVLSSKQRRKLGKDKKNCVAYSCEITDIILDTSDCGSLIYLTTQTQSVANKELWHPWCHNDRPCLGNTHSNKTWVLHIPLLCFTTLSLKMMGRYWTYLHQVIFNLFWVEISQPGNT